MSKVRQLALEWSLTERLRDNLFIVPALCIVAAIVLSVVTLTIDRRLDTTFELSGSADSARSLLSTLASAMLSFTGLVFSITIVALQLASSQWSPRVMRAFLHDRASKVALGTFVATFTYAFAVVRGVSSEFIPNVSLAAALVLLLVSVVVFIYYIDHMAHRLRVSTLISAVGDEGREVVERLMPADCPEAPAPPELDGPARVVCATEPGVVLGYDADLLVRYAVGQGCVVELVAGVGSFVVGGGPLLRLHDGPEAPPDLDLDLDEIPSDPRKMVQIAEERTTQQDLGFIFRQLVDVADRALSPSLNDPTTAAQVIDRIHDLLRMIGGRPIPSGRHADEHGATRIVAPATDWEGYVAMGVDEVMHYGADHPQVRERLLVMLDDLRAAVSSERRPPLDERRRRLTSGG